MAEGGISQEVNNNLFENQQEKKMVKTKEINQDSRDNREAVGFAELPPGAYVNSYDVRNPCSSPEHRAYTAESSTALKAALFAPPLNDLTPPNSLQSSKKTDSSYYNGASNGVPEDRRNGTAATPRDEPEKTPNCSSGSSDPPDSQDSIKKDNIPPPASVSTSSSGEGENSRKLRNNLSSDSSALPQPSPASGAPSGALPQNIVYVPMSFVSSAVQPLVGVMSVPFSVNGGPGVMMSGPPNISSPAAVNCEVKMATVGPSYVSNMTYDSRHIPPVRSDFAPASGEENTSNGTRSYSLNPSGSTNLKRLRKPVLEWIRKKLDVGNGTNWEALADFRGWRYDDIRSHLHDCRHKAVSPFLELLETDTFLEYTVDNFLDDMKKIRRIDIVKELDIILQQANTSS